MSGYQPMDFVRPRMSKGAPPTPVVPIARVWPEPKPGGVVELPRFINLSKRVMKRMARQRLELDMAAQPNGALPPAARRIIVSVCERHCIDPKLAMGISRLEPVVRCRQEIYYALHQTGRFSLPQIGRFTGRDHTTVLHGIRMHHARLGA